MLYCKRSLFCSKSAAYTDSPTYHRLEDYYTLPEGAYYVTRDGKVDKSYVKVILFNPPTVEEHIYETATVRFSDEEDIRILDTIPVDRPIKGCCFGTENLCYILTEKYNEARAGLRRQRGVQQYK